MEDKKIIIFDMDGVLFDSIGFAREFFIQRHPGVTKEMYNELHSGNLHAEAAKYSHLQAKATEEEKLGYRAYYSEKKSRIPLFPGVKELLINLHDAGHTLVLNTNAYDRNCLPLLENSGIRNLFDFIASADVSKDKIEKFRAIQNKYGIGKDGILFVTDALGDVKDAGVVGIPTIAVTYGVHDKTFFERETHLNLIGVVDTVNALTQLLNKILST